jgi:hypothetical protein
MIAHYQKCIVDLSKKIALLQKKEDMLSLARIVSFVIFLIVTYKSFETGNIVWILSSLTTLVLFIFILKIHFKNADSLKELSTRRDIYQNEINVLCYQTNKYYDGISFINSDHDFTSDMDIFGQKSLFEYTNRCATGIGNTTLAGMFSNHTQFTDSLQRQEAVKELSIKHEWVTKLRISLFDRKYNSSNSSVLSEIKPLQNLKVKPEYGLYLYFPVLIVTLASIIFAGVGMALFILPLILALIINHHYRQFITDTKTQLEGREKILYEYGKVLSHFENQKWDSSLLNDMLFQLKKDNVSATMAISRLSSLSEKLDYSLNFLMAIILNFFFMWDLLISLKINNWFNKFTDKTRDWFEVIGQLEALMSLSVLQINHPQWVFPEFSDDGFNIKATDIGHPLIAENQRICNDYFTTGHNQLSIVTGSNMAGKSTFLRTIGINIILARAGAPVCAQHLTISDFKIMTYLNITDSLNESTSTFYREIKRLKKILDTSREDNNTLLLLDELLRGTNSADKAKGNMAITRELIRHQIPSIIATHNLELADMENHYPENIKNYFFDITITDLGKMMFDYKLKPGVCNTFNATLLLKEIGIEI